MIGRQRRLEQFRREWGVPRPRAHDLSAISAGCESRLAASGDHPSLDARTWRDLHLDTVFDELDRSISTLGQHALYYRLRTATPGAALVDFEVLATRMAVEASTRERAQLALSRLQDPHGYDVWTMARMEAFHDQRWHVVCPLLALVTAILAIMTALSHGWLPWLMAIVAVDLVVRLALLNRITAVGDALRQIAPLVTAGQELQFIAEGTAVGVVSGLKGVQALGRLKTVARWLSGDPLMLSFSWNPLASFVADLLRAVYEYVNIVLLLDANGAYFAARQFRRNAERLIRVVAAMGELDAAISVAAWRAEQAEWTRPEFVEAGGSTTLHDIRHPLVTGVVPNSLVISAGRGVIITGSNMSGKSTFLRTVGVNAVLAQTINTCLATRYVAPVFQVRSCIGREDDLAAGKSYYLVEVEAAILLMQTSGDVLPHLYLCDELFRGTNAVERLAIAEAVLAELLASASGVKPHIVLAATHDDELVDALSDTYDACHFSEHVGPEGLVFDFLMRAGRATTRNAIALLARKGAPRAVIERATQRAGAIERQRARSL